MYYPPKISENVESPPMVMFLPISVIDPKDLGKDFNFPKFENLPTSCPYPFAIPYIPPKK